jgi:hypothetical protein
MGESKVRAGKRNALVDAGNNREDDERRHVLL